MKKVTSLIPIASNIIALVAFTFLLKHDTSPEIRNSGLHQDLNGLE